jgi:benzil reductase ((S)-benzoin forming)
MKSPNDKFAFVTGTSSGLGKATAKELLSRDWEVTGASRRSAAINKPGYRHIQIDLSDLNNVLSILEKELKDKLSDKNSTRFALVNNAAGTGETVKLEELNADKLLKLYTVNVITPVWLMGLFYKNCKPEVKLRIINISSGAAYKTYSGLSAYGGTKAALRISGKDFAEEHPDDKRLAVLSFEPGTVDTEMQLTVRSQPEEKFPSVDIFKSLYENKKLVKPEIVAKEIADFLEANDRIGFTEARFGT